MNGFWLVLESEIKCQTYFTAQLGWQCLILNVCHWEIRKYTSDYIRNPKICSSSSASGLSLISYMICTCKNTYNDQCHLSWRAKCQKRGEFLLTLPMIRVCPEAWVLITYNSVRVTSNGPNGHTIIWSLICNQDSWCSSKLGYFFPISPCLTFVSLSSKTKH